MSADLPMDPERDEIEEQAATAAALQAERDEADAGASETMPKANAEDGWDTFDLETKVDALRMAVVELFDRLTNAESNLVLVGQSLVRILHRAGEVELSDGPIIEKPKMVVPSRRATYKTRNSR